MTGDFDFDAVEMSQEELDAEWQAHEDAGRCGNCEMGFTPHYGMAPHSHDLSGGSFVGSTRIAPREEWPEWFVEDPECEGLGTWHCERCWKEGKR